MFHVKHAHVRGAVGRGRVTGCASSDRVGRPHPDGEVGWRESGVAEHSGPHVSRETLPPPEMLPVFELHLLHFHDGVRVRVRIAVPGKAR